MAFAVQLGLAWAITTNKHLSTTAEATASENLSKAPQEPFREIVVNWHRL
jgi:hypothetical protein